MNRSLMISALTLGMGHVFMNQAGEGGEGAASVATSGTRIRPDLAGYQSAKSASGSTTKICGDAVSLALVGATLDEAYVFVSDVVDIPVQALKDKYSARNVGQQRMFLGNLIRGGLAGKDKDKAARIQANFDAKLGDFRKVVDARMAEAQKEREAEAKRKADEKAKKEADAKAKKEADAAAKKEAAEKAKSEAKPATGAAPVKQAAAPKAPAQPQS